MNEKQRKAMFANMKYKGTDNQLHDLVRKKPEDTMHYSLHEIVKMNKPRSRQEYQNKSYTIKGSVLRYTRMSAGRMAEKEQKLDDKKYLWELFFDKKENSGLFLVPKHLGKSVFGDDVMFPNKYIPVTKYNDGTWTTTGISNFRQDKFDSMGIDPKQFLIPESSKLSDELVRAREMELRR